MVPRFMSATARRSPSSAMSSSDSPVTGVVRNAACSRGTSASPTRRDLGLSQRVERAPELGREKLGLLPGGEVIALVGLGEVGEGGVGLLGPAVRCPADLAGEGGEA